MINFYIFLVNEMHKRPSLAEFKKKAMQNEEFKKEYERLIAENEKTKRPPFESFMKKAMQNEEFRKEYEQLAPEFELLDERIRQKKVERRKKRLCELLYGAK